MGLWNQPPLRKYINLDTQPFETVIKSKSDVQVNLPRRQNTLTLGLSLTIIVLIITNIFQSLHLNPGSRFASPRDYKVYKGAGTPYYVERRGYVPTKYMSENETEAAAAWASIQAGHGIVAIDVQWAAAHGLPPTHTWIEDSKKLIYAIEAYHAIHCIRTIRAQYMTLLSEHNPNITWDTYHTRHCFDSLRQYVMCTADDTLLQSHGHARIGVNQKRQCREWDALRDFATKHTAHYDDDEKLDGASRWYRDDHGSDGLPVGSLLE